MTQFKVISVISLAVIVLFVFVEGLLFLHKTPTSQKIEKVITIPQGTSFMRTARVLKSKSIITNRFKFYLLARWNKKIKKIKAGEYLLATNLTPAEVLDTLVSGRTFLHRVTIPEGYNMYQVADVVAQAELVSKKIFLETAKDALFVQELKLPGKTVEGYLFPESYFFSKPVTAKKIIRTMVERFNQSFTTIIDEKARRHRLSRKQVVILASVIEKETGIAEERRLISAVFHNRLKKGMKFQSDPTVIYGMFETFSGNLSKRDLLRPTPYNTYTQKGFPVGPIANPGKASLEAAVDPAQVSYLYFVSKNDGSHFFSSRYRDHINAVNRYQRKRK